MCAEFGEYLFGEGLLGEDVKPNEQAEQMVVSIATVTIRFI
jgi:hypothetical protein